MAGKTKAKATKADFVECETCSEEAGREVLVNRAHLKVEEVEFLGDRKVVCPKGHVIESVKVEEVEPND